MYHFVLYLIISLKAITVFEAINFEASILKSSELITHFHICKDLHITSHV
jgi:hypothetical protein